MKFTLRSASSAAILVGLAGSAQAVAQQAPAPAPQTIPAAPQAAEEQQADRVVVTGSFIAGTPEDAALPVEVFNAEDLEKQGSPTGLEFVKSLSLSGPTTGEAYYFGGAGNTGSPRINLRGIGSDRTLTLLNGRRMSQNIANMPAIAIARTEILKDGAAVIYGADATGGVVNYITRDDFVGFETRAQYKAIDGSNGDYDLHAMAGLGADDMNLIVAAEWEHRSRLDPQKRDFSNLPYATNPAPWSATTNLANYVSRTALPAVPSPNNPSATVNGEFGPAGTSFNDFNQTSCESVGGVFTATSCMYGYLSYYNLVEQQDIYRLFAQINSRINDNMDFHADMAFGEVQAPAVFGSPSQPGNVRGPGLAQGGTSQYYVPAATNASYAANPYVAQALADAGYVLPAGTQGFTMTSFRPFAHQGNPVLGEGEGFGTPSKIDNQIWRISTGLKGNLGDWAGAFSDIGYDFAATYNQSTLYNDTPDVLGYRLQQALAGFGGPNCNAADLDPVRLGTQNPGAAGTNGCLWFNPFSSSFTAQPELHKQNSRSGTNRGLALPAGVSSWENSQDLVRWIFGPSRYVETMNNDLTIDMVFNTETPLALPGGNVGIAFGGQWRQVETRQTVPNSLNNGATPCEWPIEYGQVPRVPTSPQFNGCTPDGPGPYIFFSPTTPNYADRQSTSFFLESSIPITSDLNIQAAVRREDFSGGLGATVYKVSGKWDVFGGPLSLRASYGTNYAAPPITLVPGRVTNGVASITKAGSAWLGTQTITRGDVVPETAKVSNVGLLWNSQGLTPDSKLTVSLDYFDIKTEDQIGQLATTTQLANWIFGASSGNTGTATVLNCADPITQNYVLWQASATTNNNGSCITGVTRASDINVLKLEFGNGPGQHTAGLDLAVDYEFPVGEADVTLGTTVTNVEIFQFTPTILGGVKIDSGDQRLGQLNFSTVAGAAPRWRGNVFGNINMGDHNLRATVNYVSHVTDERGNQALATGGTTSYGTAGEDFITLDLVYQLQLPNELTLTAGVQNALDQDPPEAREEFGYDPLLGDPLGRVIQFGIKKSF
ncbi:MAG TPA: TonB-dependent receptor [Hyphomonadaceae bacterium]|nr:TonB-dependent receptor [Hyphomonadaceae bacterium]